ILFVAKSVGTIIASAYAEKHSIRCRQILYTPLKYTYNFVHRDAIAFIGTSDPWSIVPEVQALSQKQQVPMYTYKNANHSLETTDTLENLKILQDVMGKTKGFLERK
ncbi:MAG: alpha/beta hydrolase, partial [Blautia wexlerae]